MWLTDAKKLALWGDNGIKNKKVDILFSFNFIILYITIKRLYFMIITQKNTVSFLCLAFLWGVMCSFSYASEDDFLGNPYIRNKQSLPTNHSVPSQQKKQRLMAMASIYKNLMESPEPLSMYFQDFCCRVNSILKQQNPHIIEVQSFTLQNDFKSLGIQKEQYQADLKMHQEVVRNYQETLRRAQPMTLYPDMNLLSCTNYSPTNIILPPMRLSPDYNITLPSVQIFLNQSTAFPPITHFSSQNTPLPPMRLSPEENITLPPMRIFSEQW